MRWAAEVYLSDARVLRLGAIVDATDSLEEETSGVARILLYRVESPGGLADPERDTPLLLLDPLPSKTSVHARRRRGQPVRFEVDGQLRCWLAKNDCLDFELEFDDSGEPAAFKIGTEDLRKAFHEPGRHRVARPPVADLSGSGQPGLLNALFRTKRHLTGQAPQATLSLDWITSFESGCRGPNRDALPYEAAFRLELGADALARLEPVLREEALSDPLDGNLRSLANGIVLRQRPKREFPRGVRARPRAEQYMLGLAGLPHHLGAQLWNCWVSELVEHAETARDGRPRSLLPLLDTTIVVGSESTGWHLAWSGRPGANREGETRLDLAFAGLRVSTARPVDLIFPSLRDHRGGVPRAIVQAYGDPDEAENPGRCSDNDWRGWRQLEAIEDEPGLAFFTDGLARIKASADSVDARRWRVGSLDLEFSPVAPHDRSTPDRRLGVRLGTRPALELGADIDCDPCRVVSLPERFPVDTIEIDLLLPVVDVRPGGQDGDVEGFAGDCEDLEALLAADPRPGSDAKQREIECLTRRPRPLVIPDPWKKRDTAPAADAAPTMLLDITERRDPARGSSLDLRLVAHGAGGREGALGEGDPCDDSNTSVERVLVLDPDPFFAAVVAHEPVGPRDASTGTDLATWTSRGINAGAWHLHLPSRQGFCLTLPPQGVGETMERYGTFGNDETAAEDTPADFRFSPPARLSMRATYYEQNFPEAPWNLRRLLTSPGRELAGAELEAAHFELLYGLSCHLEPDEGILRLAEIQTLIGAVPGVLDRFPRSSADPVWLREDAPGGAATAYDRARRAWALFLRQLGARLAIFEVWDPARLSTLRRREGVTCWIRSPSTFYPVGTEAKAPAVLAPLPPAELAHPIDTLGTHKPPLTPEQRKARVNERHLRDLCAEKGGGNLCGGITWGFESRNVFEATVRPSQGEWPRSTAAEISDLRLSALGAWGHQMAAFDAGRTTMYGDVAMGRTFAYRIERIGRIGVFWHRAKHVIVYERGVVPSRQFAGDQDPLGGRPVLRKVREYVEILENERAYPDSGGGQPRALGFVRRVTFGQQADEVVRFHVKSAWGQDVDWLTDEAAETGWKVPIWIEGAEPADVFPRPRVRVTVQSVIDGEAREVERFFDNPENLFFFTRTTDPGADAEAAADTDTWPPAPGVDFVELSRPTVGKDSAFSDGRLRQTTPNDRAIPPGHGATTFRLEASPHGVDLAAYRQEQPMAARLATFTMSRSIPGPSAAEFALRPDDQKRPVLPSEKVAQEIEKILAGLPDVGEVGAAQLAEVGTALERVATTATGLKGEVEKAREDAEEQLDAWQDTETLLEKAKSEGRASLDRELKRWLGSGGGSVLEKALRDVVRTLIAKKNGGSGSDALREVLEEELDRLVLDIVQKVTLLTPSPLVLSGALLPPMRQAIAGLEAVVGDGVTLKDQVGADANAFVDRLDKEGAAIERKARGWLDKIERVLGGVDEAASAASRVAVGGAKVPIPGLGPEILDSALATLREKARQVRGALAALRELVLRGRSVVDLTEEERELRTEQLKSRVHEALRLATSGVEALRQRIEVLKGHAHTIETRIQEIEQAKMAKIQELDDELREAGGKIIDEIVATTGEVEDRVGQWVEGWLPTDEQIGGIADEVERLATDLDDAMQKHFTPKVKAVESTLDAVAQRARDLKGDLEGRAEDLRRQLEAERDALVADLEETYAEELGALRRFKGKVDAVAEPGLRLVRAFGEPPEVGGLQFDRPETAFVFKELEDRIDITPVIGRVAQAAQVAQAVGDVLEPLGIDLPVRQLGEQLLPEELTNFDLSDILPDIAGLRLDKLFSGVKMPGTGENVKVRHGIDPQTKRGYFHAELETKIDDKATVFATGPLELAIVEPTFWGRVDAQIDTSGNVRRTVDGRLSGDWHLTVGGTLILIIKETKLEFDEGGELRFRIRPEQVVLPDTMQYVSDLLETISPDVDGLTIRIEPTGVSSILTLPLPDLQAGTSGITGLSLGASLTLRWVDTDPHGRSGFSIALAFHLSHPERPFAVSFFILGGGGYLTVDSKYFPTTGLVATEVRMAITASASLAIALGPISGGVFVYFGITGSYSAGNGALDIGAMILIVGRVSVLGIATASIQLGLEVRYSGGALVGTGFVSITIKICWCFTLKVRKTVRYSLGGGGRSRKSGSLHGPRPVTRLASLGRTDLPEILPALAFGQVGAADRFDSGVPVPGATEVRDRVRRHLAMLA